jgi:hypothetical protein
MSTHTSQFLPTLLERELGNSPLSSALAHLFDFFEILRRPSTLQRGTGYQELT